MLGYTTLQHAQPISFWPTTFDGLLQNGCLHAMLELLLNLISKWYGYFHWHCTSAGTIFPIDRIYIWSNVGFSAIAPRRCFWSWLYSRIPSQTQVFTMHMTRICEEIINWCSNEFKFRTHQIFQQSSSIMPQKKNPDMATTVGNCNGSMVLWLGLLTVMKSLPLAHNKYLQEDKKYVLIRRNDYC